MQLFLNLVLSIGETHKYKKHLRARTPNQCFSLGGAQTSLHLKGDNEFWLKKKKGWRKGVKADLQGLFQHQSATSFFPATTTVTHTHTQISRCHKHTYALMYFPPDIKKGRTLAPCFCCRGLFPASLPRAVLTVRTRERTEWLRSEKHLQEIAERYREMIKVCFFFSSCTVVFQMHRLRANTQCGCSLLGTSTLMIAYLDP